MLILTPKPLDKNKLKIIVVAKKRDLKKNIYCQQNNKP